MGYGHPINPGKPHVGLLANKLLSNGGIVTYCYYPLLFLTWHTSFPVCCRIAVQPQGPKICHLCLENALVGVQLPHFLIKLRASTAMDGQSV